MVCAEFTLRNARRAFSAAQFLQPAVVTPQRQVVLHLPSQHHLGILQGLIYNDPRGYADLILNGDPKKYLKNAAGSHGSEI